jgi:hypothetical protein
MAIRISISSVAFILFAFSALWVHADRATKSFTGMNEQGLRSCGGPAVGERPEPVWISAWLLDRGSSIVTILAA